MASEVRECPKCGTKLGGANLYGLLARSSRRFREVLEQMALIVCPREINGLSNAFVYRTAFQFLPMKIRLRMAS